jgi:hypothetical protein
VLDHTPLDEYDEGDDQSAIDFLLRFATVGLSRRFREYVGERVAEFTYTDGEVAWRWLSDLEAAPILAGRFGEGTWRDRWPSALDYDLFFPNCTAAGSGNLAADDLPFDGWWYQSLDTAIGDMERVLRNWEQEWGDADHRPAVEELLAEVRFCRDHQLILCIS